MPSPIPASPIPQTPPKIGTRYVGVHKKGGTMVGWPTSWAWKEKEDALTEIRHEENADIYALLDPADAAELERLRKAEEAASDTLDAVLTHGFKIDTHGGPVRDWREARADRIAFEKKIGGGK